MTTTEAAPAYEAMTDPEALRIAIRELYRVAMWIRQFADLAAEMPGVEAEHVMGIKSTETVIRRLLQRAQARLRALTPESAELRAGLPASQTVQLGSASC